MKAFRFLLAATLVGSLVGCGGGGGGNYSTGGTFFTHEQLAAEFVRRVNTDVVGYDIELVKTNTAQFDYIVVYDWTFDTYDAYWLGNYNVGENLANYLINYNHTFYFGLWNRGDGFYEDLSTGILFEKVQGTNKNLATLKAAEEMVAITKAADQLHMEYGMSMEKAVDAASFAYKLKHSAPGTYKTADYDAFAKELVGSSITEFQNDYKNGKYDSLASRIELAGEVTGMGSEGVQKLIKDVMGQN